MPGQMVFCPRQLRPCYQAKNYRSHWLKTPSDLGRGNRFPRQGKRPEIGTNCLEENCSSSSWAEQELQTLFLEVQVHLLINLSLALFGRRNVVGAEGKCKEVNIKITLPTVLS